MVAFSRNKRAIIPSTQSEMPMNMELPVRSDVDILHLQDKHKQ